MTAKLDKTFLEVEHQPVETVSLLTVLETADFDLDRAPSGVLIDTATWSDVMAIVRRQVQASYDKLGRIAMRCVIGFRMRWIQRWSRYDDASNAVSWR
jgi:uncharacterized protein YqgV (UPF0045/DUF77 family)